MVALTRIIEMVGVSPKERGESQRESDAPTQRQPDMASAQTQIGSELPDPLTYTTIPALTIYITHQHITPDSSTRMVSSKIKINTSEHREQISVLRIRLTKQGLSHVRSTMHTILIATGASGDACEVRSLSVRSI